jgi:hyaluronan synthase
VSDPNRHRAGAGKHSARASDVVGRRQLLLVTAAVAGLFLAFGVHHWLALQASLLHHHIDNATLINLSAFTWLCVTLGLAHSHRDTGGEDPSAAERFVSLVMTLYNEDPAVFMAVLRSIGAQTRVPDRLWITDDGSGNDDCHQVFLRWHATECPAGVDVRYTRQDNTGKRGAQAAAFRDDLQAHIFVTVDSDVILDPNAVEQGIRPFQSKRVMSVAGFLLGLNYQRNLLTCLVDVGFVSAFLNGRGGLSRLGSVSVNAGGLAFYRAHVIRDNLDHYLAQKVLGRHVQSGDDAMLTRYALLEGRCLFQRSAVGYTLHPEKLSHLTKQRLRWWRSFFWGNVWLLYRFPMGRIVWWMTLWQFVEFAFMSILMPLALVIVPVTTGHFGTKMIVFIVLLAYIQSAQYLSVRRPDQTYRSQVGLFLLAPFGSILNFYLGWMLQYAGLVTVAKSGWSTRQTVEVGLGAGDTAMPWAAEV